MKKPAKRKNGKDMVKRFGMNMAPLFGSSSPKKGGESDLQPSVPSRKREKKGGLAKRLAGRLL